MKPGMIDVTGVPLEALVRAAYDPSRPQGLGMLHYQEGDLTDEEVAQIVKRGEGDRMQAISMDYVKGRSCKFHVQKIDGRLYINNSWYDHSDSQLRALLTGVGLSADLLDQSRKAQAEYEQECIEAALAFLKEQGGSFIDTMDNREGIPAKVIDGLAYGAYSDKPRLKREWVGDTSNVKYEIAA